MPHAIANFPGSGSVSKTVVFCDSEKNMLRRRFGDGGSNQFTLLAVDARWKMSS
jgi:hypothetical protein